jgi:hypothetical protein
MLSNLLKWWRDAFTIAIRLRGGFGAFRKETEHHPASSYSTIITGPIISNSSSLDCLTVLNTALTMSKLEVCYCRVECYVKHTTKKR